MKKLMSADTTFYKDNKCISLFIIMVIRTKFLSTLRGSNNRELTVAKFFSTSAHHQPHKSTALI